MMMFITKRRSPRANILSLANLTSLKKCVVVVVVVTRDPSPQLTYSQSDHLGLAACPLLVLAGASSGVGGACVRSRAPPRVCACCVLCCVSLSACVLFCVCVCV